MAVRFSTLSPITVSIIYNNDNNYNYYNCYNCYNCSMLSLLQQL